MTLHAKNLQIIDTLIAAIGDRDDLNTTDKSTIVAAINELKAAQEALGTVEHEGADISGRNALTDLIK